MYRVSRNFNLKIVVIEYFEATLEIVVIPSIILILILVDNETNKCVIC